MAVKVAYKHGTKQAYLSLAERNPYALYWCTDTRELFKGNDLFTDGVRTVDSYVDLPGLTAAADGVLHICLDTGNGYILNTDRTGWQSVFYGVDNETIGINESGLMEVKQIPIQSVTGLETKLAAIEQSVVAGAPIASADTLGIVKASGEIAVSDDGTMSVVEITQSKVAGLETRLDNIEAAAVGGIHYKGSVLTTNDLPTNPEQGDLYEVKADNSEWCWNSTEWFEYGNASGLKPLARCEVNQSQFEILDSILNIKSLDASLVNFKDQDLKSALDEVIAAISWEEFGI